MSESRWLVDEMLGRLARYLRFLGYDTEYVKGIPDEAIAAQAQRERRRLITRDRALAAKTRGSVLLTSVEIGGQVRELLQAYPRLRHTVRFDRCSVCNGPLLRQSTVPAGAGRTTPPPRVRAGRANLYACADCKHLYWQGSHTSAIQSRLRGWLEGPENAP